MHSFPWKNLRHQSFSLPCILAILTFHFDADPDPACPLYADADLDPTFHFDADPDPSFQKRLRPLKRAPIGSYSIHFGLSSAN